MYKIRIDPLKKDGTFDSEFYTSSDYQKELHVVEQYLRAEGFDTAKGTYDIMLLDRVWIVIVK